MQITRKQKKFVKVLKKKKAKTIICMLKAILADVFEKFWNICLVIYELDLVRSGTAQGLAWRAAFKKINVKLDLLINICMLSIVENGIRGGLYIMRFIDIQKLTTNINK